MNRSFDGIKFPEKNRISVSSTVAKSGSSAGYITDFDRERIVMRDMREQVADKLVHEKIEKVDREFTIDYRLDFYVFSPDELAGILRQMAQEYYRV